MHVESPGLESLVGAKKGKRAAPRIGVIVGQGDIVEFQALSSVSFIPSPSFIAVHSDSFR
jgi:hypothetical protein